MNNYYFDADGYLTHQLPATPGTVTPRDATRVDPPEVPANMCLRWDIVKAEWVFVVDRTGTKYWTQDGLEHVIAEKGVDLPNGTLADPPPSSEHLTHNGSEWIRDFNTVLKNKLEALQSKKVLKSNGGFLVNGVLFDSDERAMISYAKLQIKMLKAPDTVVPGWKASTGIWLNMDQEMAKEVDDRENKHYTDVFGWHYLKEQELKACTTVEDLDKVDIS